MSSLLLLLLLLLTARSSRKAKHIQDFLQRIIDLAIVLVDRVITVTAFVDDVIRCSEGDFRVLPLDLLRLLHNNNNNNNNNNKLQSSTTMMMLFCDT